MTFSVDPFLGRRHRGSDYDCLAFACDVWLELTGEDIRERLDGLLAMASSDRRISARHPRSFTRLDGPRDPCLVLMRRPRTEPHVGVYLRRRVLHLTERGAEFQTPALASRGFKEVSYYV